MRAEVCWIDKPLLPCVQLLKLLNSNTENPMLIWDNATRAELTEYLADQQQQKIRTVSDAVLPCRLDL